MPTSSFVGCQSIGAMRSSNLDEWPSFHLRKTVQRMAIPPTLAATTMRTVVTITLGLLAAPWGVGGEVDAAPTTARVAVFVTVDLDLGAASSLAAGVTGSGVGVEGGTEGDDVVLVVEAEEAD
jgi:hypothetical protein